MLPIMMSYARLCVMPLCAVSCPTNAHCCTVDETPPHHQHTASSGITARLSLPLGGGTSPGAGNADALVCRMGGEDPRVAGLVWVFGGNGRRQRR